MPSRPGERAAGSSAEAGSRHRSIVRADLSATEARGRLPRLIEDVRDGTTVYLTHYGRRVAALVPADLAEHLDRVEDYWSRRAADAMVPGTEIVRWEKAIAELEGQSPDPAQR